MVCALPIKFVFTIVLFHYSIMCNMITQCNYLDCPPTYNIVSKMLIQNILKRRHSFDEIEIFGHESHTSFLASVNDVPSCKLLLYMNVLVTAVCTYMYEQDSLGLRH
jgi:hypothetical protein